MPDMRLSLSVLLLVFVVSGCRCSPATPQPVKLRVINTTRSAIYVDNQAGKLGLTVKRDIGGTLFGFDDLACTCRYCVNICDTTCSCPDAGTTGRVQRIEPGSKLERTWDGVVQTSGLNNCGAGTCLDQQNAPVNEPFTVELCFNAQKPSGVNFDDAGVGNGSFPAQTATCTTRQFAPQDLEVEIGPAVGSSCTTTADCKGMGELCFDGACTTGCPANDFPALGAEWILNIANPDNMGFFEMGSRTKGSQLTGTGTMTSAVYQSNSLIMSFSRPGPVAGELLTGRVQIKMPIGTGAPLVGGAQVKVLVVNDGETVPSRAFVLRDALTNDILLAADMGQNARILTTDDLAPFAVNDDPTPVGCTQDVCGRLLYVAYRFSSGASSVQVLPGKQDQLSVGSLKWNFLNVSNGAYGTTRCDVTELRPYAFWKVTTP